MNSYVAAEKTAEANLVSAKATLEQKDLDWKRGQSLYENNLIPKSDYDTRKAAYDVAAAAVAQNQAAIVQAKAQTQSASGRIDQATAALRRFKDVLNRTVAVAPFDGIVTNLPVREGETVVIGIQNAEGSTLMTIADMSVRDRLGRRDRRAARGRARSLVRVHRLHDAAGGAALRRDDRRGRRLGDVAGFGLRPARGPGVAGHVPVG